MRSRANFKAGMKVARSSGKASSVFGNLVSSISDQMVLPTDIIHGKSKFYAFYVEMMFGSSRADYLWLFMTWSIVQIVLALESTHQGLVFQRGKIMLLSFQP